MFLDKRSKEAVITELLKLQLKRMKKRTDMNNGTAEKFGTTQKCINVSEFRSRFLFTFAVRVYKDPM